MTTKELDLDNITNLLAGTTLIQQESGVSFAGKSLKLNNEDDAKEVVDAILECKNLIYLNLEGNTLGVDAAKGIAKALESHPEFKRALWKDIFTGRLKEEIPDALRFLGSGLVLAGATLTELNLSDNAFGPIGVDGLASLLKSPVCFALQELKLNNNGLGITGGKLLSKALMKCYESSKELNKPLALKVFIAGRNRLENEGAKALSEVFKTLGTLEEIIMPQNGIYHIGVTALADALISNQNLRVLDLNDNTVSKKGSIALAKVLPMLQQLTVLNLGDCLLKTSGALSIASALKEHKNLQEVHLACNEINKSGGLAIADVLAEKKTLNKLVLDGNQFGENGIDEIKSKMSTCSAVTSISEDEGSEDEDEEEGEGDEEEEEEEHADEDKGSEEDENNSSKENNKSGSVLEQNHNNVNVTAADFFCTPTPEKFLSLGNSRTSLIIDEIKKQPDDQYLETLMSSLMKVSSLATSNNTNIQSASLACSDALYQELFNWASSNNQSSLVNNSLLVHLGLLKSEDKKFKVVHNIEGCKTALEHAMKQSYFPSWSKDMIMFFLDKKTKTEILTVVL